MSAGGVLKRVKGLTHEKLIDFLRSGYIAPRKARKGSFYYNDFSLSFIQIANLEGGLG
jgi:hypothetical protein